MKTPKFRIGFEMECCIHGDIYSQFQTACYREWPLLQFGSDGSIVRPLCNDPFYGDSSQDWNYNTAELRSQPMDWDAGLLKFEKFLAFLYPFSQDKLFLTNSSCGLHINTSEASTHNYGPSHDEFCDRTNKYYVHVLRNFDERRVLKMFGRFCNEYCHTTMTPRERTTFTYAMLRKKCEKESMLDEKYLSCANRDGQRIEFRALGNANYERKWSELKEALEIIHHALYAGFQEMHNSNEVSEPIAA